VGSGSGGPWDEPGARVPICALSEALIAVRELARLGQLPQRLANLKYLAPDGVRPIVLVRQIDSAKRGSPPKRRVRNTASATNWDPQKHGAWITFAAEEFAEVEPPVEDVKENALRILVHVMDEAERSPQLHFVALKLLRDRLLVEGGFEPSSPERRQAYVAAAIERGYLTTGKRPNPKNPQYPVTSVQLNRGHPDVRRSLGHDGDKDDGFEPIPWRGEPLSATVLGDRR